MQRQPWTLLLCDCGCRFMAPLVGYCSCPECGSGYDMSKFVVPLDKPRGIV